MPNDLEPKRTIRRFPGFTLQFDESKIRELSKEYPDDDNAPFAAGLKIASGEDFSLENLRVVVEWKSGRRAKLLRNNSPSEIEEALSVATNSKEPRTAITVLTGLCGVEVPMASAILTCIDRERYTVIDWRALEALGVKGWPITIDFYVRNYLPECRRLANVSGMDLRTVDRALWSWSKKESAKRRSSPPCIKSAAITN